MLCLITSAKSSSCLLLQRLLFFYPAGQPKEYINGSIGEKNKYLVVKGAVALQKRSKQTEFPHREDSVNSSFRLF